MAGLTREARAAEERLPARIAIGVLARAFPHELLDDVIGATDTREVRSRLLPARLVLLFVLACWLFMRSGYGRVLSKMVDARVVQGSGVGGWAPPTTAAIGNARARLGVAPVRLLFDRVKGVQGALSTPGVFWRDQRVVTMDGFTADVPDTDDNAAHFGRGVDGSGTPNPYPQLRAVLLGEAGTRAVVDAVYGPFRTGEQTLAEDLVASLRKGMLCLADRDFTAWALWRRAFATGAHLLWRVSASFKPSALEVLGDGSYIAELHPPRKKDGAPIRVRVIEYTGWTQRDDGTEMSELFCLVTTLLDPTTAPMAELAGLYHDRWQADTTIGEIRTLQRGGPEVVLRSKSPELVEQEFWAMLCVYQAIRDLLAQAARAPGLAPTRISFKHAAGRPRLGTSRSPLN
ncbi:MAG TPA: IS4 family transposase [Micromonosporaceae bacterium]|nr:IS4 family transposase [Micromonosporaceae bacterium]